MHLIDCATFIPFFGPQDVMDVITERTYAAIHYYERTEPGYEPKTLEYLKKIKRKIFDEGFDLEKTQTVINDFELTSLLVNRDELYHQIGTATYVS